MERLFQALADGPGCGSSGSSSPGRSACATSTRACGFRSRRRRATSPTCARAGLVEARREGLWMHYRLADTADPLVRTIREAVTHALGHVDAVRKDAERLEEDTAAACPLPAGTSGVACCASMNMIVTMSDRDDATPGRSRRRPRRCSTAQGLPLDGLADHFDTAIVARQGDAASSAAPRWRSTKTAHCCDRWRSIRACGAPGSARRLTDAALDRARARRVPAVYLLTTTADRFFPRFGFTRNHARRRAGVGERARWNSARRARPAQSSCGDRYWSFAVARSPISHS